VAAKKGGHAVQRRYRAEGRDPTAKASDVRQIKQGRPATPRPLFPRLADTQSYQPDAGPDIYQPPSRSDPAALRQGWGSPEATRLAQERLKFKQQTGYFDGFEGEDGY
jgi:hypothetical protein